MHLISNLDYISVCTKELKLTCSLYQQTIGENSFDLYDMYYTTVSVNKSDIQRGLNIMLVYKTLKDVNKMFTLFSTFN